MHTTTIVSCRYDGRLAWLFRAVTGVVPLACLLLVPVSGSAEEPPTPHAGSDQALSQPAWNGAASGEQESVDDDPLADLGGAGDSLESMLDMDLDQLTKVPIHGIAPATLGDIGLEQQTSELPSGHVIPPVDRKTPAAVTRIDYDQIVASGARSLNELFEIYVPNVQVIRHHYSMNHVAPRGLVSDAEDKYLLLVNGRVMNLHTFEGATSERDLPMLGDIHHIDFIRGPGSAVYGPGAVSGVVSITTHSGLTIQGTDFTVRQGAVEQFTQFDLRYGKKFCDDTGFFAYFGITDYEGSDVADSPAVFGSSFTTPDAYPNITAGEPFRLPIPNDHASYRGLPKHKAHLQFDSGSFTTWLRYTNGGEQAAPERPHLAIDPVGFFGAGGLLNFDRPVQFGYQQLTYFAGYTQEWSDTLSTNFRFSYDWFDFERGQGSDLWNHHSEDEYYGRVLTNWAPNDRNSLAFGVDISRENFGLPSPGFPHLPPVTSYTGDDTQWWTTMTSLLAEYRWQPNDLVTFYLGTRQDIHTYTDWMSSPRAVLILTPNERDTFKVIASQAVRKLPDGLQRQEFVATGGLLDNESIQSLELRWERQRCEHVWGAISAFYQQSEFVGYVLSTDRQEVIADVGTWGLELEAAYTTERTRFLISHSLTTLDTFDLFDDTIDQGFSSMPWGFGSELANWSPFSTKFQLQHRHNRCTRSFLSMVAYWGFPGSEDFAAYDRATATYPAAAPGYDEAFGPNLYITYGLERELTKNATLRLHLYNVAGWLDESLNKRNYILGEQNPNYRTEAASVGVSLNCRL